MSNYTDAPATKLLATRCACCNRELLDAVSVEGGIGPDCRKKYMGKTEGASEDARIEANQIVYQIALTISGKGPKGVGAMLAEATPNGTLIARLRTLGFAKLADKLEKACMPIRITESGSVLTLVAPFCEDALSAQRSIPGRWWDGARKCTEFPVTQKLAVWAMLCRFYAGLAGVGPKGAFVVPAR